MQDRWCPVRGRQPPKTHRLPPHIRGASRQVPRCGSSGRGDRALQLVCDQQSRMGLVTQGHPCGVYRNLSLKAALRCRLTAPGALLAPRHRGSCGALGLHRREQTGMRQPGQLSLGLLGDTRMGPRPWQLSAAWGQEEEGLWRSRAPCTALPGGAWPQGEARAPAPFPDSRQAQPATSRPPRPTGLGVRLPPEAQDTCRPWPSTGLAPGPSPRATCAWGMGGRCCGAGRASAVGGCALLLALPSPVVSQDGRFPNHKIIV